MEGDEEMFVAQELVTGMSKDKELQAAAEKPNLAPAEAAKIAAGRSAIAESRDRSAQRFPDSFPVQSAVAAAAVQAGDWKKGEVYADKAVALGEASRDPGKLADALRTRAIGAYQAGDFPKAAADAKRVLEAFPGDRGARAVYEFSKGRVKAGSGTVAVAVPTPLPKDFPAPSPWNDPRVKQMAVRAADRVAAVKKLEEAHALIMREDPSGASARDGLALAAAAQRLDPTLTQAYMDKALAWSVLKDLAKALVEVTRAIGLWTMEGRDEKLPAAYGMRSGIGLQMGDYPLALSDADKALAYDPNYARGYLNRATAREKIGKDVERAIDDYKRAAELEPSFKSDYDAAVARLATRPAAAQAPSEQKALSGWAHMALSAAFGLLGLLVALVWRLTRRRDPEDAIGFASDRKELDSQYDIVAQIGEGGMGMVYKGWDKVLKRPVAVKKLRGELQSNPRERERFLNEAELVASLHHPHIVDIYTIVRDERDTHLVFEFVSGMTLHELLNEAPGRRLPPAKALDILRQIGEAVDHAHARHVIHRDMKPANVMLADGGWVKVMDFGIARQVMDSLLTTTNTIVGTPVYMAPEQAMGAVVKESDVFSLGVTLYELLTGALPFKGPNEMSEKMEGRFVLPSVLVPALGPAIDEVVRKALSPRPEDRFHRCGDLHQAAVRALDDRVTPAAQR